MAPATATPKQHARKARPPKEPAASVGGLSGNVATLRMPELLKMFAFGDASYGVTELSRALGLTKNMVYRALTFRELMSFLELPHELGFLQGIPTFARTN
jgi:hypothetical protein